MDFMNFGKFLLDKVTDLMKSTDNKNYKKRLSDFNKKHKLGYEYDFDTNKHAESFNQDLLKAEIVI